MRTLNFALIGCGRIAKRHSELLGHGQIHNARLVAVCDLLPAKATKIASEFSVPHFTEMHEMMRAVNIDVVVVLTESGKHAEQVVDLASYGKHIVVEKPMALTLDDADAMIKACDASGAKLFVVKQNRFNVPVVKLRQALESPAWPAALAALPGYTPARSGEVLSLTQALPWWHFRVSKPAGAAPTLARHQGGSAL